MKLYIGCSLTQAPEEFKSAVDAVKKDLRKDFEVLDFVGTVAGTASDVYQWDIHECIAKCDVFIAICDYPAIGLGYELGVAVEKLQKPTLALAHNDTHVSRLVLGIDQSNYAFKRYTDMSEIPKIVAAFIG